MQISAALEVLTTLYSEDGELFLRFGEAIERFAERAANALAMMLVAHQVTSSVTCTRSGAWIAQALPGRDASRVLSMARGSFSTSGHKSIATVTPLATTSVLKWKRSPTSGAFTPALNKSAR
jgi:hypothetical protein